MDYFWVRRGYGINISHLFKPRGIYWYTHGVNWRAMVAWFVALAHLFPGMLYSMGVPIHNRSILNMYSWNYVLVIVFSGLLYLLFTLISPVPVRTDHEDLGKLYLMSRDEIDGVAGGNETGFTIGYAEESSKGAAEKGRLNF
jgi:NCS1 family nucleobase:cation symporter-1